MTRLRSFSFTCVLPLLLAALAARALVPAGFMATGAGLTFTVEMCSLDPARLEQLEIPGAHEPVACDYCLAPLLGTAFDLPRVDVSFVLLRDATAALESQLAALPLARAQLARAPPHA